MKTTYLKDIAYNVIKHRIIECHYTPGSILNVNELMNDIGASRTPIHDAMLRLQEENLVTIIPKKGIIVQGITLQERLEVLELRIQLEPYLILKYGDLVDKETLVSFIAKSEMTNDIKEMINLHAQFNDILYSACLNRRMQEVLRNLEDQNQRNRNWRPNEQRVKESCQENIRTARHLLNKDLQKASKSIRKHLEEARKFAMKKYV